jgi:hypothetical protein
MIPYGITARAKAVYDELSQPNVSAQRVKELSAVLDQLDIESRNYSKALSYAGSADPNRTTCSTRTPAAARPAPPLQELFGISGTPTRDVGSDTPLDALSKAFVDLRTGSAFAEPDLVIVHPSTLGALCRPKDLQNRYLLDVYLGPAALDQRAEEESIWGVRTCQSTMCPAGSAVVMSIQSGAAVGWIRMSLTVEFNSWGDTEWKTNTYSWRAEERISLSVPRPAAINIVTGLPTS